MAMVVGMFMAILDIQIVSASITDIQAGLAASPDEAAWVQTSYLIAEIVMIPLSGWLSRLLSTRVLFVASALGFTVFSLLCAGATGLGEMVVFRAAQGFIGGAMIPTVFATDLPAVPGRAAHPDVGGDRTDRDDGAHHRPDARRLADRQLLLALAVPDQRAGRAGGGGCGVDLARHRPAGLVRCAAVSTWPGCC